MSAPDRPTSHPRVSIVVTVRDEAARLPALLAALTNQTLAPERYELIIVDDGSRDGTVAVASAHRGAIVVELPAHMGLPAGRNAGVRRTEAPVIVFTDADCLPDEDWLEAGLRCLGESDADILAGGISVPIDRRSSIAALIDAGANLNQEAYARLGFGAGANLWVRREVFERAGLFNERVGMYGDEMELCERARATGARLLYAPEVHVVHPARSRLRDVIRKAFLQGFGLSAHRRFGQGALRHTDLLFLQWRSYLPTRSISGMKRLGTQSFKPSGRQLVGIYVGQQLALRLPRLLGDALGEIRSGRRPKGSPSRFVPETLDPSTPSQIE